jgi:Transcriptional regulator, AbiEi antitoxin N-terminal domain
MRITPARDLPEGLVVDAGWLERRGYSSALRSKYASHGLEQIVRGDYRRPPALLLNDGAKLRGENVVVSLQTILERPVTVGRRTALELQGFAHYLGEFREVHLLLYFAGISRRCVSAVTETRSREARLIRCELRRVTR